MKTLTLSLFAFLVISIIVPPLSFSQCAADEHSVEIEILTDAFSSELSWDIVDNCTGSIIQTGGYYAAYSYNLESHCIPNTAQYTLNVYDSGGDGMCCAFGAGYYNVQLDGANVGSGSIFGSISSHVLNPATVCGTASCTGDELIINVQTDAFGEENHYEIKDLSTGSIIFDKTSMDRFESYSDTLCIPTGGCMEFTFYDDGGNGVCCAFGTGSYEVLLNGVQVGFGDIFGSFQTHVIGDCPTAPDNDFCENAIELIPGEMTLGTTLNATIDYAPAYFAPVEAPGVWYKITPIAGQVNLTTCGLADYDIRINAFIGGDCNGISEIAGNDNGLNCGGDGTAELNFCTNGISTYYILVQGTAGATGNFGITANCLGIQANDMACAATMVSVNSITPIANYCNRVQWLEPSHFSAGIQNTCWYTFIAPASGCVGIAATGFDSEVAVYEAASCTDFSTFSLVAVGEGGAHTAIPTADPTNGCIESVSCLTPGQVYYIQVDGANNSKGTGELHINDNGGTPLSVDAGDCQTRFIGYKPASNDTLYLLANASGGEAPYSYSWSPAGLYSIGSGLAVLPNTATTYTVTVTDARGCVATATVDVDVVNVTGGACPGQVQLCWYPPSTPTSPSDYCANKKDVAGYLGIGFLLGPCSVTCRTTNPSFASCTDLTFTYNRSFPGTPLRFEIVDLTAGGLVDPTAQGIMASTSSMSFCVDPSHCYALTVSNSPGVGLAGGSYTLEMNGTIVTSPSGGTFHVSETVNIGNCTSLKTAEDESQEAPVYDLAPNPGDLTSMAYPNPFTSSSSISFTVPTTTVATVEVFNMSGVRIAQLFNREAIAGEKQVVEFDGGTYPAGIYFYKIHTESGDSHTGKLIKN